MKKTLFLSLLLPFAVLAAEKMPELFFDPPPRILKIDRTKNMPIISGGKINFEIVVPPDAGKPAGFAGEELRDLLKLAAGKDIPMVSKRSSNVKYAIVLGDSAMSRNAGIDVSKLVRDGFFMRTVGNEIFIAGIDDKQKDARMLLHDSTWKSDPFRYQRGTLYGVYDFLERFAGMRFYFPGELGTIIPKITDLNIPVLDIMDRPDCTVRKYGHQRYASNVWFSKGDPILESNLNSLRWRVETRNIPNCHGLQDMGYFKRFGKSNPEFFALKRDGSRYLQYPGYLCLSNKELWNEIFLDAKSALSGEPPEKRGIKYILPNGLEFSLWPHNAFNPDGFFNVHLMDGWYKCQCAECRKYYSLPDEQAGEIVWEMTAEIAKRIKAAGINAYITQMGYHFFKSVPKADLPDNVLVQLASSGPWETVSPSEMKKTQASIKAWRKKLNKKIWLWNYIICSSSGPYASPGTPQFSPRTVGKHYRTLGNDISGAFMETDYNNRFIIDAMNLYTGMKLLWDTSLDPDALVDEYYQLMFGKAAPEMKKFFDEFETLWTTSMRGKTIETPSGPQPIAPSRFETWESIYTPARIREWQTLFSIAEKKTGANTLERKRIDLMRLHFLDIVIHESKAYYEALENMKSLIAEVPLKNAELTIDGIPDESAWKSAIPLFLGKIKQQPTFIQARVKLLRDADNLYISFISEDPETARLVMEKHKQQDPLLFEGATFEIFLNPSADWKNYYQLAISPSGSIYSAKYPEKIPWIQGNQIAVHASKTNWSLEAAIPLALLPGLKANGFPANFSCNRQIKGTPGSSDLYSWSPYLRNGFHDIDKYGYICFERPENANLIRDYDFEGLTVTGNRAGKYWTFSVDDKASGKLGFDGNNFVTGGQSFFGKSDRAEQKINIRLSQNELKLKPDTKYRFSYFMRANLEPGAFLTPRIWAGKNFFIPPQTLKGNFEWTQFYGEFKTPAEFKGTHMGVELYGKGNFNIDHIVLKEIK
ncbi:MAG: hypothetical protein BWY31_03988 [Lentisphaerae bacterium ADurb.Bin242]|nr:MAG: hypothetical protein BWY31_03988 [Lentisphaerae bacterium ADurb.Bin242]